MFPKDFLFGVSTSAYQIEGGYNEDGKGESIWDRYCHDKNGKVRLHETADVACDHYHRYKEDINLIENLGCNVYRFSIAWTRILPNGIGEINQKGIDFYNNLINGLKAKGIKVAVTLYHWDLPVTLQDKGGWANPEIVNWFTEYAKVCFENFGDRVDYWITLNEVNCFTFIGYLLGFNPPCICDYSQGFYSAHYALVASGNAIREFRKMGVKGKIGISLDIMPKVPISNSKEDILAAEVANATTQYFFYDGVIKGKYPDLAIEQFEKKGVKINITKEEMDLVHEPLDFLGLNYYTTMAYKHSDTAPFGYEYVRRENMTHLPLTDWELDPQGLYDLLVEISKDTDYKLPILISENGIAVIDTLEKDGSIHDVERTNYVRLHLEKVEQAIKDGVNMMGYCYWSLMDNFEWNMGFYSRFGIYYVDYATQKRYIKDTGKFYKKFIAENKAK